MIFRSLLVTVTILCVCRVEAEELSCPNVLSNVSQKVDVDDGWQTFEKFEHFRLVEGLVYSGHPSKNYWVKNNFQKEYKIDKTEHREFVWDLSLVKDPWIQCSYRFTSLVLIRSVEKLKSCTARFKKMKTYPPEYWLETFICK